MKNDWKASSPWRLAARPDMWARKVLSVPSMTSGCSQSLIPPSLLSLLTCAREKGFQSILTVSPVDSSTFDSHTAAL